MIALSSRVAVFVKRERGKGGREEEGEREGEGEGERKGGRKGGDKRKEEGIERGRRVKRGGRRA